MIRFPQDNYVVFDFETTGFIPGEAHVIQMSALKVKGDKITEFNEFVKVDYPVPEKITELTGITDAKLAESGQDEEDAWFLFNNFIENLPLVGHNSIAFDRLFLEEAAKRWRFDAPIASRYIDTAMMMKAKKLGETPKYYENHYRFCIRISEIRAKGVYYKLQLCCDELGLDTSHLTAHQSDSDYHMTNMLYRHITAQQ